MQFEILKACEKGDLEIVKSLLEKDPNLINAKDGDSYTPLHRACYSNNIEIVEYLLQKGADIFAQTEMHWQPLHSCCKWNNFKCAALLIQNGADVNAVSEGGKFHCLLGWQFTLKLMSRVIKLRFLYQVKLLFI